MFLYKWFWTGKKERVNHPTQKPLELCEKLIKACKNGDDTLLVVPFAGSGSECVAAKKEKINFIGFEINEEYVKLCNERLDSIIEWIKYLRIINFRFIIMYFSETHFIFFNIFDIKFIP